MDQRSVGDETPVAVAVARPTLGDRLVDGVEQAVVVALNVWVGWRIWQQYLVDGRPANLLMLGVEGLLVLFVLFRRAPSHVSRSPREWLLGFGGTCLPLAIQPGGVQLLPPVFGAMFIGMGLLVQLHAMVTLGRSLGVVPAHRGLRLHGPYQIVRHPLYAAYLLSHIGFLMLNPTAWNAAVYTLVYLVQVPRLLAEERLLSLQAAYREYCVAVPYRLIPGVF